ncbi:CpsB/CapC family capsule biosynthesis tyrosine phosphatase [Erysipelothrix urinaevulpis]|uniref:CpsB/CapC family capsule biosynthesis tyrosine phosphatase n=1 Tax=Erysipelothrix urinaevulpis TaxID=2683717 RepID=UPI00135B23D7|nr:CpsB/CapC family capsule biosynthesis tyrosine phosphatase [Erysipelothrix urinaevulpis]
METNLVDIHSHILFGIDDGAKDLSESLEMARVYLQQGVGTVVATPHFDIVKDNLENFLGVRDKHIELLRNSLSNVDVNLQVLQSAELYFRHELLEIDLSPFIIEGTDYLLIELPTRTVPNGILPFFEELIYQGYNPILAHMERYAILRDDTQLLHDLAEIGVLFQVNNETIINGLDSFMKACFKKGYISFVGSDAHGLGKRKINYQDLETDFNITKYNQHAQTLIHNQWVEPGTRKRINKILGKYI